MLKGPLNPFIEAALMLVGVGLSFALMTTDVLIWTAVR